MSQSSFSFGGSPSPAAPASTGSSTSEAGPPPRHTVYITEVHRTASPTTSTGENLKPIESGPTQGGSSSSGGVSKQEAEGAGKLPGVKSVLPTTSTPGGEYGSGGTESKPSNPKPGSPASRAAPSGGTKSTFVGSEPAAGSAEGRSEPTVAPCGGPDQPLLARYPPQTAWPVRGPSRPPSTRCPRRARLPMVGP